MNGSARRPTRRKARRVLLQVLYEIDSTGHSLEDSLHWAFQETALDKKSSAFIRDLAHEVIAASKELDEIIQKYAPNWPITQLAAVDRNILRIAIYEMNMSQQVSVQIAINEAVELAKRFGGESTPRFVNGVLGSVAAATSSNHLVKK